MPQASDASFPPGCKIVHVEGALRLVKVRDHESRHILFNDNIEFVDKLFQLLNIAVNVAFKCLNDNIEFVG